MSDDDPFGLSEDFGRTRVRPPPSGARRAAAAPAAPVVRDRAHPNPFVVAFGPLLEFAPELEAAQAPDDSDLLRARLERELVAGRDAAVAAGAPMARADAAAWAVAALLDDLAINTPWGGASAWPSQPLLNALYGHVDAGEQFFTRLETLERHPSRDRDLLELHYLCLALGFRGKYRVPGRAGDRPLAAVRTAAAAALRDPETEAAPLSPHWRGVIAPDAPRRFAAPIWVLAVAALALVTAIYVGLSLRLAGRSEELALLARAVPPPERAEVFRVETTAAAAPPEALQPVEFELLPAFVAAAPEGLRPALGGRESVSLTTLVIQWTDPEVFQSARAALTPGFEPLIAALAQVIVENADVIGGVTVVGHTDSIPLQSSNPLSSNQRLSEARAETIARLLVAGGVPAELVHAEGRAATEPVADNGTRQGRALNRRVEVLVEKRI
ncbi:type IVB secretion system protein IcmH/DotU [Amaricoccus sp.]|uniref:type IVB secretion system protein IcmH/DotU n=1 Tax=Amaricoccus sp. TaxID=1872485 RepID=UPI001B4BE213|nr:type IVB secretion system protein IcmH/DotU [Amaricoccus sp.]MBP7000313.1 type IVB secretion system protein IcmH/DotU [Amaricoccus sp.]